MQLSCTSCQNFRQTSRQSASMLQETPDQYCIRSGIWHAAGQLESACSILLVTQQYLQVPFKGQHECCRRQAAGTCILTSYLLIGKRLNVDVVRFALRAGICYHHCHGSLVGVIIAVSLHAKYCNLLDHATPMQLGGLISNAWGTGGRE